MYRSATVLLVLALAQNIINSECQCSRSLPSYDESSFTGGSLTAGIQLLIPSWNFSCQGFIREWQAHVLGNTSIGNSIEFQIYEPDSQQHGLYHSVYSNTYVAEHSAGSGSMITLPIMNQHDSLARIPVREGNIVGIYIKPEAADLINLLYDDANGVDVYYWENVSDLPCDRLICDGSTRVMNINPLFGWTFMEITNGFSQLLTNLQAQRNVSPVCSEAELVSCPSIIPQTSSSSITPSSILTSSSLAPLFTTLSSYDHTAILSTTSQEEYQSSTLPPTESTSTTPSPTPNVASSPKIDTLQLSLVAAVAGLLVLAIVLTITLILLLLTKCGRSGRKSKQSPGINPSYSPHSILGGNPVKYIVQDYCQPGPRDTLKKNIIEHDTWDTTIYDEPAYL